MARYRVPAVNSELSQASLLLRGHILTDAPTPDERARLLAALELLVLEAEQAQVWQAQSAELLSTLNEVSWRLEKTIAGLIE